MKRPKKITFGEMRQSGPRRLLVYCSNYKCGHSVVVDADRWSDDVRLSDLEPNLPAGIAVTAAPTFARLFEHARMGTGA